MSELSVVATGKSDMEKAAEYKRRLRVVVDDACEIINEAAREGITLGFGVGRNGIGLMQVMAIEASKQL